MNNFGEELTYWYLRLNGFFLVDNLVLHRADLDAVQNADIDLIGVRHPNTVEVIGLNDEQDFCAHLRAIEQIPRQKTLAILGEVKAGGIGNINLQREDRITYGLKRTGLLNADALVAATQHLLTHSSFSDEACTIAKVVFSQNPCNEQTFYNIRFSTMRNHIQSKFRRYLEAKDPAKLFFPSTLMQYLIWDIQNPAIAPDRPEIGE